jgi:NAD(P)-dependent dehydrogenase (short-subunit alcohol dehydrogenase family)
MNQSAETVIVVVTGASSGIGAAIARRLAETWSVVACLSRSGRVPPELEDNPAIRAIACDVTDEASLREVFAELSESGEIRALVNNAGIHVDGPAAEMSTDSFRSLLDINALGLFVACREVHPHLSRSGGGQIINIGSFLDEIGVPTQAGYCASKAAVAAITRCLAVEWARDDIQVVNLAPGYVATDMNADYLASEGGKRLLKRIPMKRAAEAGEIADMVDLMLARPAPYMTGNTIYMDGGFGVSL